MDKYKYYIRGSQSKRREKAKKGGKKSCPTEKQKKLNAQEEKWAEAVLVYLTGLQARTERPKSTASLSPNSRHFPM